MIKEFKYLIISAAVFVLASFLWISFLFSKMNALEDKAKQQIGKQVVIASDTLTIVDYSMINETYKLSNGKDVSMFYVTLQSL